MASSVRVLLKVILSAAAGVIVTLLSVSFALSQQDNRTYPSNVFISGIPLAGLNGEEAYEVLKDNISLSREKNLLLKFSDSLISIPLQECGISYDPEDTLEKVDNLFYGKNVISALLRHSIIRGKKQEIALAFNYNEDKLYNKIIEIKKEFDQPAVDARIFYNEGYLEYIPHRYGYVIDVDGSVKNIFTALEGGFLRPIELSVTKTSPRIKLDDIKKVQDVLGAYASLCDTWGLDYVKSFISSLNGLIIMPDEVFSLHKVAGLQGEDMVQSSSEEEGINQVKNAVYQSCLQAGLKMEKDSFVIANNRDQPVLLTAVIEGRKLVVRIFGCQLEKGKKISIITEEEEVFPEVRIKVDSRLSPQQRIVKQEGKNGLIVRTYRLVSKYGREIEKTLLTEEAFAAIDTIILVGPDNVKK